VKHSIEQLIDSFWSGQLSLAEKQELLKRLSQEHPEWIEQLEAAFHASLENQQAGLPSDDHFNIQFRQLKNAVDAKSVLVQAPVRRISPARWWKIAAIFILLAGAGSWFLLFRNDGPTQTADRISVSVRPDTVEIIRLINTESKPRPVQLSDGSELQLEPGAAISYRSDYGTQTRQLHLDAGIAVFKVAKDKLHPFSVSVNNIRVKALGTEFRINKTNNRQVAVLLTEGSVSVQMDSNASKAPVLLKPGQELIVKGMKHQLQLADAATSLKTENEKPETPKVKNTRVSMLQFDQRPLDEVFNSIAKYYKVNIDFEKEEVKELWFTGSFKQGDSLTIILKTICKLNRLSFRFEENRYIISKK
jgi:hypothetical protein